MDRLRELLRDDAVDWEPNLRVEFETRDSESLLSSERSAAVLERLHVHMAEQPSPRPTVRLSRGLVRWAAVVALALTGGWFWFGNSKNEPIARQTEPAQAFRVIRTENTGTTVMNVVLGDGSSVALEPRSSLEYPERFEGNARTIRLAGEAQFSVAKDASRPFSVIAGRFSTTALGTVFRVKAADSASFTVRLLEGKVVVRALPGGRTPMKDRYLKAGEELVVNLSSGHVGVGGFAASKATAPRRAATAVSAASRAEMRFDKDPLQAVFTRLSQQYRIPFEYDPADVRGLSFSGSFHASDSLSTVVSIVCRMNDLSFKLETGKVIISKTPD